ncbi:hypothetical protein [Cryobacterium tepidiphilum]|uniref:Uncharacterized protein n=1 Tax=Cryobacterium tepidiphilum TaxID=2486026 RepID=A0A3M8KVM2_9MICO|nr:hypothetical protein [Cryobacterium tepidiphilum]RNE56512.1 hypothetical protein EEJ31_13495 [Cryobacterium tepidiphilum]
MTSSQHASIAQAVSELTVTEADGSTWIDMSTRPDAIENIGQAVAHEVKNLGAGAVIGWLSADETVLAHIVARELGVPRAVIDVDLGLLTISPELQPNCDVLVVATSLDQYPSLQAIRTVLESNGHHVVAVVSLDAQSGLEFADA